MAEATFESNINAISADPDTARTELFRLTAQAAKSKIDFTNATTAFDIMTRKWITAVNDIEAQLQADLVDGKATKQDAFNNAKKGLDTLTANIESTSSIGLVDLPSALSEVIPGGNSPFIAPDNEPESTPENTVPPVFSVPTDTIDSKGTVGQAPEIIAPEVVQPPSEKA